MAPREAPLRLLADIGGTNARFALQVGDGGPTRTRVLACAEYPDLHRAMRAYLEAAGGLAPTAAALAVAAPVSGDRVEMTNSPWSFSVGALRQLFALARVDVVNAFTARARGRMNAEAVEAVIELVATDPLCGDLIQGTGGIRKVRVAIETRG